MTLEKIIKKLENSSLEERMKIGKNQAHIYYSFCMKYTNDINKCNTLFFGSLATIIGIDLKIDEKEYECFKDLIDETNISFADFNSYIKAWTNVKTIEDTDYIIDNDANSEEKQAFVYLCILLSISNNILEKSELGLITKYLK